MVLWSMRHPLDVVGTGTWNSLGTFPRGQVLLWFIGRIGSEAWVVIDCYTVLPGGNRTVSGVWDMASNGLAGIALLWLVGLNIDWDCLVPHCIMGSHDQWEFPPFFRPQWESLCTALTAGKCLPLRLCKGTVKESRVAICHKTQCGERYFYWQKLTKITSWMINTISTWDVIIIHA